MAKKKHHHEEHIDETWLIPYADMLTLLLALFIVLFASSSIDAKKFEQISSSLNEAFKGGDGILEFPSPVDSIQKSPLTPNNQNPSLADDDGRKKDKDNKDKPDQATAEAVAKELADLRELQRKIDRYISEKDLALSLKTDLTEKGLMITIMDNALFASGSATVKPEAKQLALEISQLLVTDPPRNVQIAGHTDNQPINTPQFRSNWDLSAMRSINFMKILLENTQLNPQRFSATGYGEYQPVATNGTVEGRATNRRVEVLILPNYNLSTAE